ncbi:DUF6597 domain-containing transcriptional factor [Pseudonocardia sp. GCM10023141]|uniref:DUF6597 domain-containing transcriptional factor n=1 Tax=Pseudonocardia sp. GCM10023141 TaxID=3252653 RepID=UPI00360FC973
MTYRELPAPTALRGAVECCWVAEVGPGEPAQLQPVLPDACMDLVWTGSALVVAGPDTRAHPVRREPGVCSAGLRFAPGMLPALLGVPAEALRDERVPVADLHPVLARDAMARLEYGAAPAAALAGLAMALPGEPAGTEVRAAVTRLDRGETAAEVADALGWTTRSLHRRSLAAFGYGPAVLRRVLRFRRAAALLHGGVALADAAAIAGYADQPHLSREVRALAGVAPSRLSRNPHPSGANRSTPLPSGSLTVA